MSFIRRKIAITFNLGQGDFGADGVDTLKFTDLRATANIDITGGRFMAHLNLSIYGMTLSHMNKLSTLGVRIQVLRRNTIVVEAGDAETGMARVFYGVITDAWIDGAAMPQMAFHVVALAGMEGALKPAPPSSFGGPVVDVATVVSTLANQEGLIFTNYGVNAKIGDLYLPGTLRQQMERVADAANIDWIHDGFELSIWPKDGHRGGAALLVSPESGMIGYPTFYQNGVRVHMLFNPNIGFGQLVHVKSALVEGDYRIAGLSHSLESETPGGDWSSRFAATPKDVPTVAGRVQ